MKKDYDLVFGLGGACSCAQTIRAANLQFLSFPNDWCGPDLRDYAGQVVQHDICSRAESLLNDFEGCFNPEDFEQQTVFGNIIRQFNRKTGCVFSHDFPPNIPIAQSMPAVREKYRRRTQRILGLIEKAKRILIVRIERPDFIVRTTLEDCQAVREMFLSRFPGRQFDFALFSYEKGRSLADRKEEQVTDWLFRVTYDYRDYSEKIDPKVTIVSQNARILSDHFSVRDYRTPEEIRRHQELHLQKKLAKLAQSNKVLYWLTRARLGFMRLFSSSASAKPSAR